MENDNTFRTIGKVINEFNDHTDLHEMRDHESIIEIFDEFSEGLYKIEENNHLNILFMFDRSRGFNLKGPTYNGEVRGVFSSRSQMRPSSIGLTTVRLLGRDGNMLRVKGLDALNGTPVLDIKPYSVYMDESEIHWEQERYHKKTPRAEIYVLIGSKDTESLLRGASQIHGHYCPGLSLGVMASTELMNRMRWKNDGLEDIVAVTETNNCFSDGVQYVTGCTFGNNALIYRDMGKTSVSLVNREGKGFRASVSPSYRQILQDDFPTYCNLFDKVICKHCRDENVVKEFKAAGTETSFALLSYDVERLISVEPVRIRLPDYAPIHDTVICEDCEEGIMSTRCRCVDGCIKCIPCSGDRYYELNGEGISYNRQHFLDTD